MRYWRQSLAVAAVLAAYALVQAALSARELASLPPTTAPPRSPLLGLLSLAGFALSFAAYGYLGRTVVRRGGALGAAAVAGAVAGLLAGIAATAFQALFALDYVRGIVGGYGLPTRFVDAIIVATLVVSPLLGAAFGALVTALAGVLFRPHP